MRMAAPALDYRSTNSLWGSVFAETLVRCGVTQAVICPGSRSTPLAMAFARHGALEVIPVLDERSASFFALGLAKQKGRPVVLLCTSGTAGANFFPAIIEAQESGVPLLIVTADRPPEMRECASGQTIDQQKLFGSHVAWYCELATPEATLERIGYLRQTVAQGVRRTVLPFSGPVHLNVPFRDPLPPIEDGSTSGIQGKITPDFFAHLEAPAGLGGVTLWQRPTTTRGIIVAGPDAAADPARYAESVSRLARQLGWPILADVLSPLRHLAQGDTVTIAAYDTILRNEPLARELAPRTVLCLGGWPTSKVLRAWLERSGAEIVLVSPTAMNRDALHGRTRHISASADQLAPLAGGAAADASYLSRWTAAEKAVRTHFDQVIGVQTGWVEPMITRALAASLPPETRLFVASSMPVRDVEYFWPADDRARRLFFNRGANGIDGTLSTAFGIAHGAAPAVLLTGDLALLHDTNGFLLRPKLRGSLTVVLINNRGGGIFEHLPVARFDPPFEELFATPQEVDFARLCSAYGVEHRLVSDRVELDASLASLPPAGVRVLEIRTDRKRDAVFRKKLFADAAAALTTSA